MRTGYAFLAVLSLSLTQSARANFYFLKDKWVGADFYRGWNWETENDPTHGRVNYVSLDDAKSKNLTCGASSFLFFMLPESQSPESHTQLFLPLAFLLDSRGSTFFLATGDKFVMRADDWSIVDPSARGRDSVRISSQTAYDEAIFVLDLAHMPAGCSTWPAFWTLSQQGPWPAGGEIDIIEGMCPPISSPRSAKSLTRTLSRAGVNLNTQNQATLHTSPGCTIPSDGRRQTGYVSFSCGRPDPNILFLHKLKKNTTEPSLVITVTLTLISTKGVASSSLKIPPPTVPCSTSTVVDTTLC